MKPAAPSRSARGMPAYVLPSQRLPVRTRTSLGLMHWLTRLLALLLALFALTPAARAERFDYRLEPRQIADGVFVLVGLKEDFSFANGGNIVNTGFIVGPDGVIVIDTGSSRRYGEQMLAAIRRITDRPVVMTLNTHHHPDHFLGNQAFPADTLAALPGTIAAIRSEGEAFNANMYRLNGDWMRDTEVVVPTRELSAGRRRIGGRDLELLALGGHTAADLVVVDHDSGTVFAADLLFNGRAPTTPHAEIPRWVDALDTLKKLPAQRWVPGHGEVATDTAALQQTRAWLGWLADTIRNAAEAGLDMNEVFATPIPPRFAALTLAEAEFRRSVVHLFPAAEQAALAPAADAAPPPAGVVSRSFADLEFAAARDALAESIAEEGLATPVVSHFGDMLARTAGDLGHRPDLYAHAEIFTFCSAALAARLAGEARGHIALCPLSIAVYALPEAPRTVFIAYRPPAVDGAGGEAARGLMAQIVARAARLLGRP